ncbi:MAG: phospholipid scramblase-related protein [Myxococcota bacterium]
MSNLPVLASAPSLVVKQQKEMLEVFTNFETKNRYLVQLPNGQPAFYAAEAGEGAGAFFARTFLKNSRPFTMQLMDPHGHPALTLRRPWTWFFSELHVTDGHGQPIGSLHQKFKFFGRLFEVSDTSGQVFAQIQGPFFRPWTFKVIVQGHEVGQISKQWGGLMKEAFTDADTFGVQFDPNMPANHRALILAATFLIDFLYFEDRD